MLEPCTCNVPSVSADVKCRTRALLLLLTVCTLLVSTAAYGGLLELNDHPANETKVAFNMPKPADQPSCPWDWLKEYGLPLVRGLCKMWVDQYLPAANLPVVQNAPKEPAGPAALAPSAMAWVVMAAAPFAPSLAMFAFRPLQWAIGG